MVEIKPKDLYQFLLTECRYGYTRNNHLMPDGAYRHVEEYLPELLKADKEMAINTAKQLVEECISMELCKFADGIDDDHGTRRSAINFIKKMLEFLARNGQSDWRPYNYNILVKNVQLDDEPRYDIYEAEYVEPRFVHDYDEEFKLGKKANDKMLSKNEILAYMCSRLCKSDSITYRKHEYKPDWKDYVESNSHTFKEDFNRQILTKYTFDDLKKAYIVKRCDGQEEGDSHVD